MTVSESNQIQMMGSILKALVFLVAYSCAVYYAFVVGEAAPAAFWIGVTILLRLDGMER